MKLSIRILALAAIASTCALISCAGPNAGYSYQNVGLTLFYNPICNGVCINGNIFTPVPAPINPGDQVGPVGAVELPVQGSGGTGSGQCLRIVATVTNAPANLTWTVYPTPLPGPTPNTGTVNDSSGSTNFYCMPVDIPVYSGAQLAQATALGLQQGETEVVVTNPVDPNNSGSVVTASIQFTSELNTSAQQKPARIGIGIQPTPTLVLPLSTPTTPSTYQFTGYVVGINGYEGAGPTPAKQILWQVGKTNSTGITGGQSPGFVYGSISPTGLYTAPLAYPATGKSAVVVGVSAAYPTIVSAGTTITFP